MRISRLGLHFKNKNAFWKDLFFIIAYRDCDLRGHWKDRGPKLFFRQCRGAFETWYRNLMGDTVEAEG